MILCAIIILIPAILLTWKSLKESIYNSKEHVDYVAENLSPDAEIINVETEKVGSKTDTVYRTTVLFDDGFSYISHKTNSDFLIFGYRIYITPELKMEIIEDAIEAHKKAIEESETI